MRHYLQVLCLVLPFLGETAFGADELPQPRKDPSVPAKLPDFGPAGTELGTGSQPDATDLQRSLLKLRAQREMLHNERTTADREIQRGTGPYDEELARKRQRLAELMSRASTQAGTRPDFTERPFRNSEGDSASTPGGSGTTGQGGTSVIDPLAMALNYYQVGDFEEALSAFKQVPNLEMQEAKDRVPVMYMIATCLRKLGKIEEARAQYVKVANSRGDPIVTFVAQSANEQVKNLDWQHELRNQLAQLQQRRKALEINP